MPCTLFRVPSRIQQHARDQIEGFGGLHRAAGRIGITAPSLRNIAAGGMATEALLCTYCGRFNLPMPTREELSGMWVRSGL
jgi:hypothetical protein